MMPRMPQQNQPRVEMTPEQREMMKAQRLQSLNPLPSDKTLIGTLREVHQCPVAMEQKQMTMFIGKLVEFGDETMVPLIAEGVTAGLNAEFVCRKSLEERTVVRMEEDPNLAGKLKLLKEAEETVLRLQAELDTAAKNMEELSKGMWANIVKNYGLSVTQRCYTVDEESGVVKQVSLDCEKCPAKNSIQEIRKKMTEVIFHKVQTEKKPEVTL